MTEPRSSRWQSVARAQAGDDYARVYADRFRALAEQGEDVHGEASFAAGILAAPARILDAGCGTGRVAVRLHDLGYVVVGCDVDPAMIEVARQAAPTLDWRVADLSGFDLDASFDLVLLAGNVLPLLEPGTLDAAAFALAGHVAPGGSLAAGFGLDAAHLPGGCPPLGLDEVDAAMAAAGLQMAERWATWDRRPFDGGGYAVSVYRRAEGQQGPALGRR